MGHTSGPAVLHQLPASSSASVIVCFTQEFPNIPTCAEGRCLVPRDRPPKRVALLSPQRPEPHALHRCSSGAARVLSLTEWLREASHHVCLSCSRGRQVGGSWWRLCHRHLYRQMLPRWLHNKESTCQPRRCKKRRFHPWAGKVPWRRRWQPTAVVLPGRFQGERSLVG